MLISIEGFDGTGKSSLSLKLNEMGFEVLKTPLINRPNIRWVFDKESQPITRFLYYLGEVIETTNLIKENNETIFCDRYIHSTIAYHTPLIGRKLIDQIINSSIEYIKMPDKVIYLTAPKNVIFDRIKSRKEIDRERELNVKYLNDVINEYNSMINDNWLVIDTSISNLNDEIKKINDFLWK